MRFYATRAYMIGFKVYKRISKVYPFLPRQLRIESEKLCNLRCVGCRRHLDGDISKIPGPIHLTLERLQNITSQVPVKVIRFSGDSEPAVNPHLTDHLRYLKSRGMRPTFTTNGTLLNKDLIRICEECGLFRISLSLTGATKESFERYRLGAKFDTVLENARLVAKSRITLFLNYTMLTEELMGEIPEFMRIARDVKADGVQFLKPMVSDDSFAPPDFPKLKGVLDEVKALVKESGLICEGSLEPGPIFRECYDPFVVPLITLNGDVFPCQHIANQRPEEWYFGERMVLPLENYIMGNIHNEGLGDMWRNDAYRELRETVRMTARPERQVISPEELQEIRRDSGNGRFAYCGGCLDRWREAGS